ncbi:hypothetical protein C8R45DRAFT_979581 [Mycena sanguinolenta]|nr:hypothetical protein C8R45DRAFT_979581 [Mycena sanguinolenta]
MDRVPGEIWLETFSSLERSHLISLHQVSRSFHRICRPLLFKRFVFQCLQELDGRMTGRYRIAEEGKFGASFAACTFGHPKISHHSSRVSPGHILVKKRDSDRHVSHDDDDSLILLEVFFELLSRFTNLRKFDSYGMRFQQCAIDAICSLPNLKDIELRNCSVDEGVMVSIPLKTTRLCVVQIDDNG